MVEIETLSCEVLRVRDGTCAVGEGAVVTEMGIGMLELPLSSELMVLVLETDTRSVLAGAMACVTWTKAEDAVSED